MEKKNLDWANLGFGYMKTDYRFVANFKGGAWDSRRTECRTEARGVGRDPNRGYANVGFRVVRESKENNGNRSTYRRGGRRTENRRRY